MRTVRLVSRTVAAPFARESAAVSALCRSATAAVSAASVGVGVGNAGFPVSFCTMLFA